MKLHGPIFVVFTLFVVVLIDCEDRDSGLVDAGACAQGLTRLEILFRPK